MALSRYFLYEWLESDRAHRRYLQRAYDAVEKLSGDQRYRLPVKNQKILLCGVGRAATAEYFCERLHRTAPSAKVTLFDLRPAVLDKAARRIWRRGLKLRIETCAGNALAMPFADESFDWIETDHFFQFFHRDQLPGIISEWQRLLRPGGRITTRFFTPDLARSDERRRAVSWKFISWVISAPCHLHSTDEIISAFEAKKFSVDARPIPYERYRHITSLAAFKRAELPASGFEEKHERRKPSRLALTVGQE